MSRRNRGTRWGVIIFGISMAAIMVLSLMTGYLFQIAQRIEFARQQRLANEPTPLPTFAPPVETSLISFDEEVLQSSGLFSIAVPRPPEWGAVESSYDAFANRARLLLRDSANVVEAAAETPAQPVTNMAELNALYNDQTLGSSWRNYTNWRETQRTETQIGERETLQLDFELQFNEQTFIARQASWIADDRVYSVRVITPENANELLLFLLDNIVSNFEVLDRFQNTPLDWAAYYDETFDHIIRYPREWQVTDAADGFPASIEGGDVALRVEALAGESLDSAGAEDYVASLPNVNEVAGVNEVEQAGLSGYQVAYTYSTLGGAAGNGAVLLLNGEDAVHVANLRVNGLEANINAPDESEVAMQYSNVLATFSTLPDVTFAETATGSAAPLQDTAANPQQFGGF